MMSTKDYYKTLGIERNASEDDVKKAYRKLVRKYHPDTNKDETAEAKMSEINEAYTVISNKEKRTSYDQFGTAPPPGAGGFPGGGFNNVNFTDDFGSVADIFDSMFGGGRRRTKNRNVVYEGADIKVQVIMTLEEAHSGKKITVDIPRFDKCPECAGTGTKDGSKAKTCPDCRGTGQVTRAQQTVFGTFQTATTCPRCRGEGTIIDNPCQKCHGQTVVKNHHKIEVDIPAGIEDGMRVRVRAEGDAGKKGGPSGDLFVLIRIKPHKVFKRHGIDLTSNVSISMYEAALGKEITVFTITGKDKIKVKPGTQPDDTLILRGKGMPRLSGRGTGDLHITFKVVIPKKMTKAEKSALKKFL
jgi:molecular chaperone DnaJ